MDPATTAIMSSLGQSIIGGKQLGGIAPSFGGGGGLLSMEALKRLTPDMTTNMPGLFQGLATDSDPVGTTAESSPVPMPDPQAGPVTSKPSVFNTDAQNASLVEGDKGIFEQFGGLLGKFDKGLEKGLSSPSQLLGLGLLGRINPDAPIAGLAAMGLLNSGLLSKRR